MALFKDERLKLRWDWSVMAILLALIVAVYGQVLEHDFIELDDVAYVTGNERVQAGLNADNARWAITSVHGSNWHPLTTLSHMLDCELFGLDPRGPHLVNVLLHMANTLLLFLLLRRRAETIWPGAFVAALFALHPLHVESVAWISERKDLLSALFWLLTFLFYSHYAKERRSLWYALALVTLALGLLSKPMVVTLPFALLLWDLWPLRRSGSVGGLVLEKLPMFVMAAAASVITFVVQRADGAMAGLERVPFATRLANAVDSYVQYLVDMLWPAGLSVVYPYPDSFDAMAVMAAAALLLVVSLFALASFRRRPYLFTGWFWYLGTLVPVIGLVHVGSQARADRYTYLPLIGIFIMIAWGAAELTERLGRRRILLVLLAGPVLFALILAATLQTGRWENSVTLFRHSISVTRDNYQLHAALGTALAKRGELEKAVGHFETVLSGRPNEVESHYSLGLALIQSGRLPEGIARLQGALRLDPEHSASHDNLGFAYAQLGMLDEAIGHYRELVRLRPRDPAAARNLAIVHFQRGEIAAAVASTERALELAREQGADDLAASLTEQLAHYSRLIGE
jgi:Flp pilus assembly protein TadD